MKLRNRIPCAIGIVLALQGINLIALLKVIVGQNLRILSPISMAATFLLLIDYSRLREFRFTRHNSAMSLIAGYLFYVTALSLFSRYSLSEPSYGFLYQLCYLLTILALWNNDDRIDLEFSYNLLYWVSGLLCIVAMIMILNNLRVTGSAFFQGLGRDSSGEIIISRATTASIGYLMFALSLSKKGKTLPERLLNLALLAAAVVVIFLSRRRSVYVASLVLLALFLINSRQALMKRLSKRKIISAMLGFAVLVLIILALSLHEATSEILQKGVNSLRKGLSTFLGNSNDDIAARYRYERIQRIPEEYLYHSSVFQFLFGKGYMTEWLDLPLIQAFNDIGLVGAFAFLLSYLIVPARYITCQPKSAMLRFTQFYCIAHLLNIIGSGIPYGSMFFPIALLIYVGKLDKQRTQAEADVAAALADAPAIQG